MMSSIASTEEAQRFRHWQFRHAIIPQNAVNVTTTPDSRLTSARLRKRADVDAAGQPAIATMPFPWSIDDPITQFIMKPSLLLSKTLAGIAFILTSSAMPSLRAELSAYDAVIEADHAGALPYVAVSREAIELDATAGIPFDFGAVEDSATIEFIVAGDLESGGASGYLAVGANTSWSLRYEQWNNTEALGFTHLGVADYLFNPANGIDTEALGSPTELTHLAYRWDQSTTTMEVYINGILSGSNADATDFEMPTGQGFLGANNAAGGEGIAGIIERVTVYNDAIDPAAILVHAEAWLGNSDPGIALSRIQDFGELLFISEPQELTIPIRNSGQANELTVAAEITEGSNFTIISAPASVAPGGSGEIKLLFNRLGAIGQFTGTLQITSNDPDAFDQVINVSLSASLIDREGPIAHYRLDELPGTTSMPDATGFGRHGSYSESVMLGQGGLATGTSMAVANGSMATVRGNQLGSLETFTLSLWVNANTVAGSQTLIAKGEASTPTLALLLVDGTVQWFVEAEREFGTEAPVLTAGTTHHVGITYESSKATLYVDGAPVASKTAPLALNISTANPLTIGAFAGALPLDGRLDDVQIYDRSLTDTQMMGLHRTPGSVVTGTLSAKPGIASLWSFDDTLADTAPGGLGDVLTPTGTPEFVPGVVGRAVKITASGLQRLRADDSDDLDLNENWTLEAFVWPDADNRGEWDRLWTKWGDGGNHWHTAFRSTAATTVENGLDLFINDGNNVINSNTTAEVPLETWSHIAFVGDKLSGTITAWLNGVQVGDATYEAVTPGNGAMNFGNFESPANELQYSGLIDEAIIHRTAKDAAYLMQRASLIRPSSGAGDSTRDALGRVAGSSIPISEPTEADFGELSDDATYEFFFNAVKGGASTAIAGNTAWALKLDQWNATGFLGTTEFGVVDNTSNVPAIFEENVHVIFVSDTATSETRIYVNGTLAGSTPGNPDISGMATLMAARNGTVDPMGDGSIMHGWATYNTALSEADIALLSTTPFTNDANGSDGIEPIKIVGLSPSGHFNLRLPNDLTADIEYSEDLKTWSVIAPDTTGTFEETDSTRITKASGYYRAKQDR